MKRRVNHYRVFRLVGLINLDQVLIVYLKYIREGNDRFINDLNSLSGLYQKTCSRYNDLRIIGCRFIFSPCNPFNNSIIIVGWKMLI